MNNLKIAIPLIFAAMCLLFTFTSCEEDSLLENQEVFAPEALAPIGPDTTSAPTRGFITNTGVDTMFIKWRPFVLELRKSQIRALYSDPNGDIYLVNYTVCQLDNSIEKWEITWNPSIPPKDRTPDPLIILSDHEGEMENDRPANFVNYCP